MAESCCEGCRDCHVSYPLVIYPQFVKTIQSLHDFLSGATWFWLQHNLAQLAGSSLQRIWCHHTWIWAPHGTSNQRRWQIYMHYRQLSVRLPVFSHCWVILRQKRISQTVDQRILPLNTLILTRTSIHWSIINSPSQLCIVKAGFWQSAGWDPLQNLLCCWDWKTPCHSVDD